MLVDLPVKKEIRIKETFVLFDNLIRDLLRKKQQRMEGKNATDFLVQEYRGVTGIIFDFLIIIEEEHFIFSFVYEFYREQELTELFLLVLEPYILTNRLHRITKMKVLTDIMTFAVKRKKQDVMEKLIMNLQIDGQCMDHEVLLDFCKK